MKPKYAFRSAYGYYRVSIWALGRAGDPMRWQRIEIGPYDTLDAAHAASLAARYSDPLWRHEVIDDWVHSSRYNPDHILNVTRA
jgi:hypothetical protein